MNCPECIVGEMRWGYVRGIGRMMWKCTDIGRGWNMNHPERSVSQYGYCGIAIDDHQAEEGEHDERRNAHADEG